MIFSENETERLQQELAEVTAERDALRARLDGGVRVYAWQSDDTTIHANDDYSKENALLILDEGVTL